MALTRTFGELRFERNGWTLVRAEPHVLIRLKHIFPRIPKTEPPPFRFPNDFATAADLEWFLLRYPLEISEDDLYTLKKGRLQYEAQQADVERILRPDYKPPARAGLKPDAVLRVYQAQAAEMLLRSKGLLLGDDVGLGKTFAACGAFLNPGALPAVVVCYPHLQKQWAGVIESFTNLRAHIIRTTKPYDLPPVDVYVFRYSQLKGWFDVMPLIGAKTVCFDEVQELRTGTSSGGKTVYKGAASKRLAELATFRLGLSATPIYNYGTEIWNIMQFLRPDVLGSRSDFLREWTGMSGKLEDPKALGTFLREQHAMLRRTKSDVGKEMPPVNRIVENIDYDKASVNSIEDMARALAIKVTSGAFTERGHAARELDLLVRHQTGVAKAKFVADFARLVVESGSPILLVGWHRDVYDIWLERLADLKPAMYTGSETAAAKEREKNRFVGGETDVMILSLRAGAGLDGLQQRCSTIIFGELDWSPGVHHQCIGRLDREGQTDYPVNAIFLVTDEGSDPPMIEVLGLKASEAAQIVDPHLGVQTTHTDTTHIQRLVDRYLSKKGSARKAEKQRALELGEA